MKIDLLTPTSTILEELGQRLARLRKQRRWTQAELAARAGIGVATLRRIEDGRDGRLGSWVRLMLALELDATLDQLLPERIDSPMAAAKATRRRRRPTKDDQGFRWGDER